MAPPALRHAGHEHEYTPPVFFSTYGSRPEPCIVVLSPSASSASGGGPAEGEGVALGAGVGACRHQGFSAAMGVSIAPFRAPWKASRAAFRQWASSSVITG
jgi:hypothetical protein